MGFNIHQLGYFLSHKIWFVNDKNFSCIKRTAFNVLRKLVLTIECYVNNNLNSHASALTYSSLLAAVPILAIVFAIGRGLGFGSIVETEIRSGLTMSPEFADAVFGFINSYLEHTQGGVFIGVGLILLLYTVIKLTGNIEIALNTVWNVKSRRSIYRQVTDYISVFLLLPIVIITSSGVSLFLATIAHDYTDYMLLSTTVKIIIKLLPYVLFGFLFTGLYMYMPNTKVQFRHAIIPGFVAGIAFQFLQYFYIHSQLWVASYNAIYGSFAALPMFMLWVNFSWIICLFGAQLSYANQNLRSYYFIKDIHKVSRNYRDVLVLLLLAKVCKRFEKGMEPYTINGLSADTDLPSGVIVLLAYELKDMRLVVLEHDEKEDLHRITPAVDIHQLTVAMVMERIDNYGNRFTPAAIHRNNATWERIRQVRRDTINIADDRLVKDII